MEENKNAAGILNRGRDRDGYPDDEVQADAQQDAVKSKQYQNHDDVGCINMHMFFNFQHIQFWLDLAIEKSRNYRKTNRKQ